MRILIELIAVGRSRTRYMRASPQILARDGYKFLTLPLTFRQNPSSLTKSLYLHLFQLSCSPRLLYLY